MRERVADHFRLLMDFLGHEVLVVALVDQLRGGRGLDDGAFDDAVLFVANDDALARQHRPVALFQIADGVGERRQRDRVGAEEHLALAVADGERRAFARADHEIVLAGEQEGERESAAQLLERGGHRVDRRLAVVHFVGHQMRDHLGVGLAFELGAALDQPFAQFPEILDDAVVHHRDPVGRMRVRIAFGRPAMGRPAGVADADIAAERLFFEPQFQRVQLALSAAARQHAMVEGGDTGGVVAAILEALERIDQMSPPPG